MDTKTKLKVAIIVLTLGGGGTERVIFNLVNNFNLEKFDITIICCDQSHGLLEDKIEEIGVKIIKTCNPIGVRKLFQHLSKLFKILKANKFDIVHSNMDLCNGLNLLVASMAKVPIKISHSHTSKSQAEQAGKKVLLIKIYRKLMRKLIWRFSDIRLGCSVDACNYLYGEKWKKDKNSAVLPNGIDFSVFENATPLFINDKINIVTVGRICKTKNSFFISEIVNELSKIRGDFKFHWVGGIPDKKMSEFIENNHLSDYIEFIGVVDCVPRILKSCKYFLFPSVFEGFGLALLEAQVSGLDCFISDTIINDVNFGKCVVISLSKNAFEWAQIINKFIETKSSLTLDKEKLSTYNITKSADTLMGIYEKRRIVKEHTPSV